MSVRGHALLLIVAFAALSACVATPEDSSAAAMDARPFDGGAGGGGGGSDVAGSGDGPGSNFGGRSGTGGSGTGGLPPSLDGSAGRSDSAADARVDTAGAASGDVSSERAPPLDQTGADAGGCPHVVVSPSTAMAYQTELVSRLSGHSDIIPGTRLPNRASAANRILARDYLKQLFAEMTLLPTEQAYGSGVNVYATLPSTTGNRETVVLGAHYDSVMAAPGANDNATGVAAVMAGAREAVKLSCRNRNVVFVLFDEEELGLVGSKRFAALLKSEGTPVHSVHTIDQMGWDSDGDRLIELEAPGPGLRELYARAAAELGAVIPMKSTNTMTTDHASFRPTFLAIGISEGFKSGDTTPHYHKVGDAFATVNFAYLSSTTTLINQVIADLMSD